MSQDCDMEEEEDLPASPGFRLDYFPDLPFELREYICQYLDAASLETMCHVSEEWNDAVSCLQGVWRASYLDMGFSEPADVTDWKTHVVSVLTQLPQRVRDGAAFEHRELTASVWGKQRRHKFVLVSSGSGLVAAVRRGRNIDRIALWTAEDGDWFTEIRLNPGDRVSTLTVQEDFLALGCANGRLRLETLDKERRCAVTKWEIRPLPSAVCALGLVQCLGLLGTVSLERSPLLRARVELRSLTTGALLWGKHYRLLSGGPCQVHVSAGTWNSSRNHLVAAVGRKIRVIGWPAGPSESYGDLSNVNSVYGITTDSHYLGFSFYGNVGLNLVYCQAKIGSPSQEEASLGPQFTVLNLDSDKEERCLLAELWDRGVPAARGQLLGQVLCEPSSLIAGVTRTRGGCELWAADLHEGVKVMGHHVPYEQAVTLATCDARWLRDLKQWRPGLPLFAYIDHEDHIQLVTSAAAGKPGT